MATIREWCVECTDFHDDGQKCPKILVADAFEELLFEVGEQEKNWDLDNRIIGAVRQEQARRDARP